MTRLSWGEPVSREFETGIDRGVLYLSGQAGIPWNGLTSVDVSTEGGGAKSYYLDGEKYLLASSSEEYTATLNAFTYPKQFSECDGTVQVRSGLSITQQRRKMFGFSYRTQLGNALNPEVGYKIHLVYNALADPTDRSHVTNGEQTELAPFSWKITTRPPIVAGYSRTAHVEIDSRTTDKNVMQLVEDALYGSDEEEPYLPSLAELIAMYDAFFVFVVTDNGDGIYTVSGPDDAIQNLSEIYLQFDWPTVVELDEDTYTISSG